MTDFNPSLDSDKQPGWIARCGQWWSVYGVMLVNGTTLIVSHLEGVRTLEGKPWYEFAWHTPPVLSGADRAGIPTVANWQPDLKKMRLNLLKAPSDTVRTVYVRGEHIITVMEMVNAAQK